jgi:allantoinase
VPYSNDINDFNMFARGALSTRDGIDMLKLCFDQLYKEGAVTGRIMNVGLHPHVIGQPHRIAALREFLEFVKDKPNVWFPSREEIATWYLAEAAWHMRQGT